MPPPFISTTNSRSSSSTRRSVTATGSKRTPANWAIGSGSTPHGSSAAKNLIFLGMYKAAADQLEAIPAHGPEFDSVDYYNCYLKLYHTMAQTAMARPAATRIQTAERPLPRLRAAGRRPQPAHLHADAPRQAVRRRRRSAGKHPRTERILFAQRQLHTEQGGDRQQSRRRIRPVGDDEQRLRYLTLTAISRSGSTQPRIQRPAATGRPCSSDGEISCVQPLHHAQSG